MDALRKQASKLREQVAKQQQVLYIDTYIEFTSIVFFMYVSAFFWTEKWKKLFLVQMGDFLFE